MATLFSLKREIDIISKALIIPVKPTPQPSINFDELTDSEKQTLFRAEEVLTTHTLNPRVQPYCIHGKIPEVFQEYNDDEKALILEARHIIKKYQQKHILLLGAAD